MWLRLCGCTCTVWWGMYRLHCAATKPNLIFDGWLPRNKLQSRGKRISSVLAYSRSSATVLFGHGHGNASFSIRQRQRACTPACKQVQAKQQVLALVKTPLTSTSFIIEAGNDESARRPPTKQVSSGLVWFSPCPCLFLLYHSTRLSSSPRLRPPTPSPRFAHCFLPQPIHVFCFVVHHSPIFTFLSLSLHSFSFSFFHSSQIPISPSSNPSNPA